MVSNRADRIKLFGRVSRKANAKIAYDYIEKKRARCGFPGSAHRAERRTREIPSESVRKLRFGLSHPRDKTYSQPSRLHTIDICCFFKEGLLYRFLLDEHRFVIPLPKRSGTSGWGGFSKAVTSGLQ
jgi:hypothetical protein